MQSNHVRQTAAAACKYGLDCHALLERRVPDDRQIHEETGNVLFDHMFGTETPVRPAGLDMNAEAIGATNKLAKAGQQPYFIQVVDQRNWCPRLRFMRFEILDQVKQINWI